MANPILPKRSSVAGKVPATTDLLVGEIATNVRDGRLFMKKTDGTVETVVEIGGTDAQTLSTFKWTDGQNGATTSGTPGWVRLGTFTSANVAGQRLMIQVTGASGFNANNGVLDRGGHTIITATMLNNQNSGVANIAGAHYYMDNPAFTNVKFTQNSSNRYSYHVDVLNTSWNDGWTYRVTTTKGATWAMVNAASTDPGADSSTVRAAVALGKVLTSSQTGSGNGLDADTVDGQHASAFATLASPAFTGTPTAPTATAGTNTTQIATTAFVKAAIDAAMGTTPPPPPTPPTTTVLVNNTYDTAGDFTPWTLMTGSGQAHSISGSAYNFSFTSGSYVSVCRKTYTSGQLTAGATYQITCDGEAAVTGGWSEFGFSVFDTSGSTWTRIESAHSFTASEGRATKVITFTAPSTGAVEIQVVVSTAGYQYKMHSFKLEKL